MSTKINMKDENIILWEEIMMRATVKEEIKEFMKWVNKKIEICETHLSTNIVHLEWWKGRGELPTEENINEIFQYDYSIINRFMKEAKKMCIDRNLPTIVLNDTVSRFKAIKTRMRNVKVDYKKSFIELKEKIQIAKENEKYVQETADLVEDGVRQWLNGHEIIEHFKNQFEGENFEKTIYNLTNSILSTKLYPNKAMIKMLVESYMKERTVTT